ncbi:MAG: cation-translocating P-type ATPase [Anaerolineae bacterium]|nr:cation-translocating P-type ATPase [Anaerolineae bacterium]
MASEIEQQSKAWHLMDVDAVLETLQVDPNQGLSDVEVSRRLTQYGRNELQEQQRRSSWAMFFDQFREIMVLVLIAAAVVSGLLGEYIDAVIIMAIVVINAIIGFVQERRAEEAMAALKKMSMPHVKVRRGGQIKVVDSGELVPGDIVLVDAGDAISADCRLIESVNLRVQEAALTGESESVGKFTDAIRGENIPIGDRPNMIYMGTAASGGRGTAVVADTGMETEIGRIAELIHAVGEDQTPLQRRMAQLGKILAVVVMVIILIVFVLGLLRGEDPTELFITGVAMAVAAIPEGLPAVVTITLALGAQRLLKRDTLIRKLPAVETLGSVTTICSDKTGTLTQNKMTVQILDMAGFRAELKETKRYGLPVFELTEGHPPLDSAAQSLLLVGSALCNDAYLVPTEDGQGYNTIGDPTESALVVAAASYNLWKEQLDSMFPRIAEIPFSSTTKRMTTIHKMSAEGIEAVEPNAVSLYTNSPVEYMAFTKGALDVLIDRSSQLWVHRDVVDLDQQWRKKIFAAHDEMAAQGFRILGMGVRFYEEPPTEDELEESVENLIFVGIVGMVDPPRPEAKEAVETCRHAGMRTIMITGDHPLTAHYIAQELGIAKLEDRVITGPELETMTQEQLEAVVERVPVFARVSPEHKLNIVDALQNKGHITAMTGDGVNDAPALRKSDIGVAMGITGTDVAKEASDMVILDDNFATIVRAVKEGRTIYDNVRKFLQYILTSNAGEVYVMLFAPFLGMPLPLNPLQILWINLVTDGLPGLALSVEPAEGDAMDRPPFAPDESIFSRGIGTRILWAGALMAVVSLLAGYIDFVLSGAATYEEDLLNFRTMVFFTLTLSQMGNALAVRSNRDSLFKIGLRSNRMMIYAVLLTFFLQLAVTYIPFLQQIFGTAALSWQELLIALVLSTVVFFGIEIEKWLKRMRRARQAAAPA